MCSLSKAVQGLIGLHVKWKIVPACMWDVLQRPQREHIYHRKKIETTCFLIWVEIVESQRLLSLSGEICTQGIDKPTPG